MSRRSACRFSSAKRGGIPSISNDELVSDPLKGRSFTPPTLASGTFDAFRIFRFRKGQAHAQHTFGFETWTNAAEEPQTLDEQAGAGQQDYAERNLRYHQAASQSRPDRTRFHHSAAFFQSGVHVKRRRSEGRS